MKCIAQAIALRHLMAHPSYDFLAPDTDVTGPVEFRDLVSCVNYNRIILDDTIRQAYFMSDQTQIIL